MFSSTVIWVGKLSASDLQKFFKNATPHTLAPWRTALPGAVDPGRRRSLAPTLSPALFSHLPPLLDFRGICYGPAEKFSLACGPAFFLLCLALSASFTPPPTGEGLALPLLSVPRFSIAEEPGALPQEKTDTSYSKDSLSSCLWQLLITNGSHGSNGSGLAPRWCSLPYPAPKTAHRATQSRVWFYRFFFLPFCSSRVAKSRSSL